MIAGSFIIGFDFVVKQNSFIYTDSINNYICSKGYTNLPYEVAKYCYEEAKSFYKKGSKSSIYSFMNAMKLFHNYPEMTNDEINNRLDLGDYIVIKDTLWKPAYCRKHQLAMLPIHILDYCRKEAEDWSMNESKYNSSEWQKLSDMYYGSAFAPHLSEYLWGATCTHKYKNGASALDRYDGNTFCKICGCVISEEDLALQKRIRVHKYTERLKELRGEVTEMKEFAFTEPQRLVEMSKNEDIEIKLKCCIKMRMAHNEAVWRYISDHQDEFYFHLNGVDLGYEFANILTVGCIESGEVLFKIKFYTWDQAKRKLKYFKIDPKKVDRHFLQLIT